MSYFTTPLGAGEYVWGGMWWYGVEGDGVWCGGVVWRLEGEKYKKYAHLTQVVLDKGLFSQPMFTALHT